MANTKHLSFFTTCKFFTNFHYFLFCSKRDRVTFAKCLNYRLQNHLLTNPFIFTPSHPLPLSLSISKHISNYPFPPFVDWYLSLSLFYFSQSQPFVSLFLSLFLNVNPFYFYPVTPFPKKICENVFYPFSMLSLEIW